MTAGGGAAVGESVGDGNIVAAGGGAGAGGGEIARPDGAGAGTGAVTVGAGGNGGGTGDVTAELGGNGAGTRVVPAGAGAGVGVGTPDTPVGGLRASTCVLVAAIAISFASVRRLSRPTSSPSAGMSSDCSWEVIVPTPRLVAS